MPETCDGGLGTLGQEGSRLAHSGGSENRLFLYPSSGFSCSSLFARVQRSLQYCNNIDLVSQEISAILNTIAEAQHLDVPSASSGS